MSGGDGVLVPTVLPPHEANRRAPSPNNTHTVVLRIVIFA
jgi:hypothetical protein